MAKILIIDDAKLIREKLFTILTNHHHEIVGKAENGAAGVELFKETSPDLVTLDITMPVMNGIQTLKKIIAHDPGANIIMCSAMGQQRLVVEAIELGAKDFIIKPFDDKRVIEAIDSTLVLYGKR